MPVYDLAVIRQMLSDAFTAEGIDTLGFDLFPQVQGEFADGMTKTERIKRFVIWADKHGRIPHIIAYVKKENGYQYGRYQNRLIKKETTPPPAVRLAGWQQRQADLARHMQKENDLLVEYEDLLRGEDDPRRRERYRREIARQKAALADYRQQLETLETEIVSADADAYQTLLDEIQSLKQLVTRQHHAVTTQLGDMESRLTAGQQGVLARIDERHRQTLSAVVARLDENQLELVNMMLAAAEQKRIHREEAADLFKQTTQILERLKAQPDGDQWQRLLAAVEEPASLEQKLKLILPIIPGILEYETELAVDGMSWLKTSWQYLTGRMRRSS